MPSSLSGIGSFAPEDARITTMAQQVKEVLPHVPLEVIRTDLGKLRPSISRDTGSPSVPCDGDTWKQKPLILVAL